MSSLINPRGKWPVRFRCDREARLNLKDIPGTRLTRDGIACTHDAAPILAEALGVDCPALPCPEYPGIQKYQQTIRPRLRPYQRPASQFLAARGWAILADDTRLGKTYSTLGAAVAVAEPKNLVICPGIARLHWAEVIKDLTGETALLLYGRAASKARWYGDHWYIQEPATARQSESLDDALGRASWVILNYDLFSPQSTSDAAGGLYVREDLPGWADRLRGWPDLAILDECHRIRGWSAGKNQENTRRERITYALEGCRRAWGLTATPQYSYFRDWWGQVQTLSGGCFGCWSKDAWQSLPFAFHRHYCEGEKTHVEGGPVGGVWIANGAARLDEWSQRKSIFCIGRARCEVAPHLPDKTRQVIRVESDAMPKLGQRGSQETKLRRARRQAFALNKPRAIGEVLTELIAGHKAVVFTKLRIHQEDMAKSLDSQIRNRKHKRRLDGCKVYSCHGGSSHETRHHLAAAFRAHVGPAVFVATIDSMPEALSLQGADSVHFVELHDSPMACKQAEDRPNQDRKEPLTIIYYVAQGTHSEHAVELLLPKIEVLADTGNKEAETVRAALMPPEKTRAEIWRRLTMHLPSH